VAGGIDEKKIVRVVGMGPALLLDKADPFNPQNRRISIIVLNNRTEKRVLEEPGELALAVDAGASSAPGAEAPGADPAK
jgi:chemotaxis protein MotB